MREKEKREGEGKAGKSNILCPSLGSLKYNFNGINDDIIGVSCHISDSTPSTEPLSSY